jgi:hypothetical protein
MAAGFLLHERKTVCGFLKVGRCHKTSKAAAAAERPFGKQKIK